MVAIFASTINRSAEEDLARNYDEESHRSLLKLVLFWVKAIFVFSILATLANLIP